MKLQKVLVARAVFPEVLARLREHFEVEDNQEDRILGVEGMKARLADKAGALTSVTDPLPAEVIDAAPNLQVISNIAVGFNNIDLAACNRRGILATNTPGVLDDTTADLTWALLMASARRLPAAERWLRAGQWQGWAFEQWLGSDIHHATLGILGMGRIGQAVARRGSGFDMEVIYHNRQPVDDATEAACKARWVPFEALLQRSDFLVLLLPYRPENHHLINAAALAQMKPTAHLINAARGGIVDDAALIDALKGGRLAGAGLDVFEGEPAINPGFLALDNVALSPHIGSSSRATRMAMAMMACDNLIAALSGRRPPNLLNPEALR